jgi:formylglycine-generating enzyme required for sulfatase activity
VKLLSRLAASYRKVVVVPAKSLDGKPYLLTLDADARSADTLEVSSLRVELLREKLRAVPAAADILLMDACQNDPQGGRSLSGNLLTEEFVKGIQVVPTGTEPPTAEQRVMALLFACSIGQRAYESPETKQGIFTHQLVAGMRGDAKAQTGAVTVGSLADFVGSKVPEATERLLGAGRKQVPSVVYVPDEERPRQLVLIPEQAPVGPSVPLPPPPTPTVRPPQEVLDITPAGARLNPTDGAVLVLVPGGAFTMGNDAGDRAEQPAHQVSVDSFWIYQREVTNEQFLEFTKATGYEPKGDWRAFATEAGRLNHPVVNVTWADAAEYCKWAGGRLPTEAEWEKAARGSDGRTYPWGNQWNPQLCNWADAGKSDGFQRTAPVESFLVGASPYYCINLVGNVWEWCADWFDLYYYRQSPPNNPTGPEKTNARVVRGGGVDFNLRGNPRCSMRTSAPPAQGDPARGFRCVVR